MQLFLHTDSRQPTTVRYRPDFAFRVCVRRSRTQRVAQALVCSAHGTRHVDGIDSARNFDAANGENFDVDVESATALEDATASNAD